MARAIHPSAFAGSMLVLALALAGCDVGSPAPSRSTATADAPVLEPTPAATPARAGLSLGEARRRTLAKLDPRSTPTIKHEGALTAGELSDALESAFTQWDAWYDPSNDEAGRWLYVVLVRQQVIEANTFDRPWDGIEVLGPADPAWRLRRRPEWVAGIWEIETGERLALGIVTARSVGERQRSGSGRCPAVDMDGVGRSRRAHLGNRSVTLHDRILGTQPNVLRARLLPRDWLRARTSLRGRQHRVGSPHRVDRRLLLTLSTITGA